MTSPWPPGSLQVAPTAPQMLTYLDALSDWLQTQRAGLDRLDARIQRLGDPAGGMDMATTLSIWQAIKQRQDDLLRVWDSGRVIETDLAKLAGLIWSPLSDMLTPGASLNTGAGLNVSLPEACRMLDALITQLSSRYQFSQTDGQVNVRLQNLRAQVERIRQQAALDPPDIQATTEPTVTALAGAVDQMVAQCDRGGDIGGSLPPLEIRAARLERDLIVSHAERATLARQVSQAASRRQGLADRAEAVGALVAQVRQTVTPPPKYAVPQVQALGDVPDTPELLTAYLAKLDQVEAALGIVETANRQALAAKTDLTGRLTDLRARAAGRPQSELAEQLDSQVGHLLATDPTPIDVAARLLDAYQAAAGEAP